MSRVAVTGQKGKAEKGFRRNRWCSSNIQTSLAEETVILPAYLVNCDAENTEIVLSNWHCILFIFYWSSVCLSQCLCAQISWTLTFNLLYFSHITSNMTSKFQWYTFIACSEYTWRYEKFKKFGMFNKSWHIVKPMQICHKSHMCRIVHENLKYACT